MTTDLDALEALAKAATPGPWGLYLGAAWQVITDAPDWEQREVATTGPDGSTGSEDDAAFIAATNPSTVLALIAELRQERERADENAKKAVAYRKAKWRVQAALSRAEETIDRIDGEVRNFGQSDNDALCEIERHLTEYDKPKEQA